MTSSCGVDVQKLSHTPPPIPRRDEIASPDTAFGGLRSLLLVHISCGISPIRECPAIFDQPRADILTVGNATGNHAAIAVDILLFATDGMSAYVVGQGKRRLLTASVDLATGLAGLCSLRRVDAEQTNARAVNFDGVAVDDG